jgi:RND family efflux transporter MFP subunit
MRNRKLSIPSGRTSAIVCCAAFAFASSAGVGRAQQLEAVRVISRPVDQTVILPGELTPYLGVAIHAKVAGFVEQVEVDRGSVVKEGQLMATIIAPELKAQRAEAEAKVQTAEAQQAEAQARVASAQSTYERMKAASATPGVIAGNELIQAEKQLDAERAKVAADKSAVEAARAAVKAVQEIEAYLRVTAPFAGVVTTRNVHPGALVGTGESSLPMFELETVNRLRLVVPVPEAEVGGIVKGAKVEFSVPAYPGKMFAGPVTRIARSVDARTRTMPVELDVSNSDGRLAAGMYPAVKWPVNVRQSVLLVPSTSVVSTSERMFVIRVKNGSAEWVDVKKGPAKGDLVQVIGPLNQGDLVLARGTDEIREGAHLNVHLASVRKG